MIVNFTQNEVSTLAYVQKYFRENEGGGIRAVLDLKSFEGNLGFEIEEECTMQDCQFPNISRCTPQPP